jgi:hypothetical protein
MKKLLFVFFISLFLFGCGKISEADEFKNLTTIHFDQVLTKLKGTEINYFQYASDGKITNETAIQKSKEQLGLYVDAKSYIKKMPEFINESNKEVWRLFSLQIDSEHKKKESLVGVFLTKDTVEKEELFRNAEKFSSLTDGFAKAFKKSFTDECNKHSCVKYLKIR